MGLFGNFFDFNHDGKVSGSEECMAFGVAAAIAAALDEEAAAEAEALDEEDDALFAGELPVLGSLDEQSDAFEVEMELDGLREKLLEMEQSEPDSCKEERHERWEERCAVLHERIAEREELVQGHIDALQEKLDELEYNEPDDPFGEAYERWEERCDALRDKIYEWEALQE